MRSPKIWLPTYLLTGTTDYLIVELNKHIEEPHFGEEHVCLADAYFTDMQMKMCLLGLGLLVWMSSTLMIGACAVGHPLV